MAAAVNQSPDSIPESSCRSDQSYELLLAGKVDSLAADETLRAAHGVVSVVIPCYNYAHYLGEAIESAMTQRYPRVEIIVVDDGSSDATAEVAATYDCVRSIRQSNQGMSAARNTGLAASAGEYVIFLDADDRLLPDAIGAGVRSLIAHPDCAFAFGRYRWIDDVGHVLSDARPTRLHGRVDYAMLLRKNVIHVPGSAIYRRHIFSTVGHFDCGMRACEDYDLYLRIARKAPILSHQALVVEYRQHPASQSRNYGLMLRSAVEVMRSQRAYTDHREEYRVARREGMRGWRQYYGGELADQIRERLVRFEWWRASRDLMILLRHYPYGLGRAILPQSLYGRLRRMRRSSSASRAHAS